jgi:hypothetical protein
MVVRSSAAGPALRGGFGAAGVAYVVWVVSMSRPVPAAVRLMWALMITGPAFLIAGLFLANWLKHAELRS